MLEQQFIQWHRTIPEETEMPIPVTDSIPMRFFSYAEEDGSNRIDLVRANGDVIAENITRFITAYWDDDESVEYYQNLLLTLSQYLAPMECFRLRMQNYRDDEFSTILGYSNLLRYVTNEDGYLSSLSYYCNEQQFGFPFSAGKKGTPYFGKDAPLREKKGEQVALPILLSAAQYKQTDKIYETRTGEQIVLYATVCKEYEGETDYIPESWHEKIVTALSCDEVYINGERVTKSDSYEIDHDNYTYSDCGVRLTRATFKVKTNVIQRNSNC